MKINGAGAANYVTGARRKGNIGDLYNTLSNSMSGDEIAVSAEAMSFSKVFAAVKEGRSAYHASEPALVTDIASRVADGSYRVDSEDIVSNILGDLYV